MRNYLFVLLALMIVLTGCLPPGAEGISIILESTPTSPLPSPQVIFLVTEFVSSPTIPALTATATQPSDISEPTLTPTPTFSLREIAQTPWAPCAGIYPSRLRMGMRAYVSQDPPLSNRLRTGPSTLDEILSTISPGKEVVLIGGPACSNDWIWWQVRVSETGAIGWTVEGDAADYWLVPCSPEGKCWEFATQTAP